MSVNNDRSPQNKNLQRHKLLRLRNIQTWVHRLHVINRYRNNDNQNITRPTIKMENNKANPTILPIKTRTLHRLCWLYQKYHFIHVGIPQEQGVKAFWRGNGAGLWLFFTQTWIQVGFYDNLRAMGKELCEDEEPDSFFRGLTNRMFFPIISSFFTQLITYPVDTARVRLSMNFTKQISKSPFTGIRTCLSHLKN